MIDADPIDGMDVPF